MAQYESWFKQDLKKPIKVQLLNGNFFSQDNQGNLIGVEVFDNGEPASLAGTVSANIIRADGGTVAATGTLSENKCSVVLPAAAYAIPGFATIVIKLTYSGVVTTLLALVVTVYRSSTDTAVDPGTVMPSIQSLIQQINTAVASIPADYSSLWTSLAPAFSTDASYVAGQYVTYNGKVYRFNTAHSGEWAAGDVSDVKLGNELTDLNSALNHQDNVLNYLEKTSGKAYSRASAVSYDKPETSIFPIIDVKAGEIYYYGHLYGYFCVYVNHTDWTVTVFTDDTAINKNGQFVVPADGDIRITVHNSITVPPVFTTSKELNDLIFNTSDLQYKTENLNDSIFAKKYTKIGAYRSYDVDYQITSGDEIYFEVVSWSGETPNMFTLYGNNNGNLTVLTSIKSSGCSTVVKVRQSYSSVRVYADVETPSTSVQFVFKIGNLTANNNILLNIQRNNQKEQTTWLAGKKIAIVGDSVSTYREYGGTYDGYISTAHYPAYDVRTVEDTWWNKVISSSGAELDRNASVGGGGVTDQIENKPSLYARANAFDSPDIVIVAHGYNDVDIPVGTIDYDTAYSELSESTFGNAYLKGVKAIMHNYPDATVVLLILTDNIVRKKAIKDIAQHLGLECVDASGYKHYASDNVHPGLQGMNDIASAVISYDSQCENVYTKYKEVKGKQFKVNGYHSEIVYARKIVADNTPKLYVLGENICPAFSGGTSAGITFSVDDDGKVTANGTNNTESNASILVDIKFPLGGVYYTLSGVKDGSSSTYSMVLGRYLNGVWNEEYVDTGDGYTFKADDKYTYKLRIVVKPGCTVSDIVFTPTIVEGMDAKEYKKYSLQELPIYYDPQNPILKLPDGISYLYTGTESVIVIGISCKKDGYFDIRQLEFDNSGFEKLFRDNRYNADSHELLTDFTDGWQWGIENAYIDGKELGRGVTTSTTSTTGVSKVVKDIVVKSNIWMKLYVTNLQNIKKINVIFIVISGDFSNTISCNVIDQVNHNGLNYVRINLADGTKVGTVDSYEFEEMRISIESHSTSSATQVNYGHIYMYDFTPMCTLFFDDGDRTQYDNAYRIMKQANMAGDVALITGRTGDGFHITIPEIHEMTNDGWDIVNHTKNHIRLYEATREEIEYQIRWGRDFLRVNGAGIASEYTVVPFAGRNQNVYAALEKYTKAMRNNDGILNTMPITDRYSISSYEVQQEITLAEVKSKIDEAISKKQWLILLFHIIDNNDEQYHWLLNNFEQVVEYLNAKRNEIKIVTMSNGLMIANGEY